MTIKSTRAEKPLFELSPKLKTPQSSPSPEVAKPVPWKPHAYQRKAVKFLLEHGAAGLLLDPGLGKTSVTLAAIKVLLKEGVSKGALVVAPLRPAQSTWPEQVTYWKDFNNLSMVVLHGKDFSKKLREDHDVYVINYEGLQKLFKFVKVGKINKATLTPDGEALLKKVDTLVWDELSKMKNSSSVRFKLIKPWLRKFARRWGLTGSPASNGLLDLFGQMYVLDEGNALGQFITHYRGAYFTPVGDEGFSWRINHGAEERIYEKIRPLCLRMDAEDYLTLPRKLDFTLKFDLPPVVRKQYQELEDDLLTNVEAALIVASNAASSVSKCRQLCSGAIYLPTLDPITGAPTAKKSSREWAVVHEEKLDLLEDLIEELQGQQLMVAYEFNHDLDQLLKRFPNTPYIGGGVSVKRGKELEDAWNAREITNLFVQPASVGHGLNMQKSNANHIAWYTLTWDFELYDQLNRRLRRQGNEAASLHCYHLVAKNSVEESVAYAMRSKFKTQKELMDALKTKRRV
jgi:SNF2 family DNA or RNA helicase